MLPSFSFAVAARLTSGALVGCLGVSLAGCGGPRTPDEMAAVVRAEAPACQRGDTAACRRVCDAEGPNASCEVACKSGDAEGCFHLAARLERGVDATDPTAPRTQIGEQDAVQITALYEKACEGGLGPGCRLAGERLLTGQGAAGKSDGGARAVKMLKRGCESLRDGLSCCGMAQLNQSLAASGTTNGLPAADDGFAVEARKWATLASNHGVTCPTALPPSTTNPTGGAR